MKTLLSILFVCMTANAQSREELHKRFGSSTSETFVSRPGVFVTVSYAETGEACEMVIHAQPLTSSLNYPITKTMESKALNEMIDDLAPMSRRGSFLMGEFLSITCLPLDNCFGTSESYERVTITRIGGTDKHRYATIQWKAAACRK
jgi:hypothetical protein